ncbi:MAG TPA: metal ABC transporter ATP-binding protein [Solirubrobacteraceae bacterium]|nr:metal ABC transporter ATP-binding protein [Solirubrobacteraceae bacterium]
MLSLQDVDVSLGGRSILSAVSFELQAGEFAGLIGANGAGKTTLMRVILGLQPPTRGQIRLAGPPRSRPWRGGRGRPAVGYVPQKFLLDPDVPLRARDLVALGLDGHRLGLSLPSRARRDRVDEMLAAVGAQAFADQRVGRLSGGEQQRVLIAHALISRPRLILLDEPLANLDIRSVQEIVTLIARLAREHQVGVLLSAHDVNPLLEVMDQVVYVASGRVACGPTDQVIRSEVLSRLYGQHVDVLHVHDRVLVVTGGGDPQAAGADLTVTHAHDVRSTR